MDALPITPHIIEYCVSGREQGLVYLEEWGIRQVQSRYNNGNGIHPNIKYVYGQKLPLLVHSVAVAKFNLDSFHIYTLLSTSVYTNGN